MDPVEIAVYVVAIPAAAAAGAHLLGRILRRDRADAGLALAAAFLAGYLGIAGAPAALPKEALKWLFHLAAAAGLVGLFESSGPQQPSWTRRLPFAALLLFAAWTSTGGKFTAALAAWGAGALAWGWCVDRLQASGGARSYLAVVVVVAATASASIGASGSAVIGQIAGSLATGAGTAWVLAAKWPVTARGAVAPFAALTCACVMTGVLFSELPKTCTALLAAAPIAAWVTDLTLARRLPPARAAVARVLAAALLGGASVAVAVLNSPPLVY